MTHYFVITTYVNDEDENYRCNYSICDSRIYKSFDRINANKVYGYSYDNWNGDDAIESTGFLKFTI